MTYEPKGRDREQRSAGQGPEEQLPRERKPEEQPPGVRLAWLLRRWWEEAGNAPGGTRPTQQALASKVGIDQTTLSRYLNPKHTSTAPPRVVETLHTHLRAPAAELERARELSRAALEENSRQRTPAPEPEPTGKTGTGTGTAAAAGGPAAVGAGSGAAKMVAPTTLVFDKNQGNPANSRLSVYQGKKLIATYRAGSGTGVKNDCTRSKGWMPNGNWKIRSKTRTYNGSVIKGYAVYLQDMRCSKKTATRTEMFIHSEMNRDGSQGRTEPRRWDGAGDYRSNGCVKLNPTDIKKMFRLLDRIGWPTHLRVVS